MTTRVALTRIAREQIVAVDSWWRDHRPGSANLFLSEFSDAIATIRHAPNAGHRYPHAEVEGVRRVPLRTTCKHVYYVPGKDFILVLAIWNSTGDDEPDLLLAQR